MGLVGVAGHAVGVSVFVLVGAVPFRAVPSVGGFTPGRDQRPAS